MAEEQDMGSSPDEEVLELVAAALASGASASEAGEVVGRSARTVRRWRAGSDLDRRVAARRREMIGEVSGQLTRTASLAAQVLEDWTRTEDSSQLRAALAVLDRAVKYHELGEVDVRVAALEARIAELEHEQQRESS